MSLSPQLRRFPLRSLGPVLAAAVAVGFGCGGPGTSDGGPPFNALEPVFMSEGQTRRVPLVSTEDEVTFRVADGTAAFASIDGAELVLQPGFDDAGKHDVEVLAAVGEGPSTSRVAVVNVADVNRPPSITAIAPVSVKEGETTTIDIEATDPDGDDVSLALEGTVPTFATLAGGVLTLTPDFDSSGSYTLTVRATDARNVSSRQAVEVVVTDVDRPAVFAEHGTLTLHEGDTLTVSISAADADGDEVTLGISDEAPAWATFDSITGDLELAPGFLDAGSYGVKLIAESNGLLAEQVLDVVVVDVNRPPTLEAIANLNITSGETEVLDLEANDPDPEDATLTVTVDGLPSWAEHSGLRIVFAPPANVRGVFPLVVRVRDRAGESAQRSFHVNVQAESSAPHVSEFAQRSAGGVEVLAGEEVESVPRVWAVVTDPDGDAIRLEVELRRADRPFTGEATHTSAQAPSGAVSVVLGALAGGEYKWQARGVDSKGTQGDWIPFADGDVAFVLKAQVLSGSLAVESFDGWTRHRTVKLLVQATPASGAGMWRMAFSNDGENFGLAMPYASSATWTLGEANIDGEHVIDVEVTDTLMNKGRFQAVVRVDETLPSGTLLINEGATGTTSRNVVLSTTLADTESGPFRACFSNHYDGPWTACTESLEPYDWTLLPGDGKKTVYARLEDVARNSRFIHANIEVDATTPDIALTLDGGAAYSRSRDVVAQIEASDTSGIVQFCFAAEGQQGFSPCSPTENWTVWTLPDSDGNHTVRARVRDSAGNTNIASAAIHLDRAPPTIALDVVGGDSQDGLIEITSPNLTLSVTASDDGSGLAGVQFSNDGIDWSAPEAPSSDRLWGALDEGELVQVFARALDTAGNASPAASVVVRRQAAVPPLPPSVFQINGGASVTRIADVVLSIDTQALDNPDGALVAYSNDGLTFTTPEPLTETRAWLLDVGVGSGTRTVYARVAETTGNTLTLSASIALNPAAEDAAFLVVNGGGAHTNERDLRLTYGVFPSSAIVTDTCLQIGLQPEVCDFDLPAAPGATANLELPDADGEYEVRVSFVLDDSSRREASQTVVLDRDLPIVPLVSVNDDREWTSRRAVRVRVEVDETDELSPPTKLCLGELEAVDSMTCSAYSEESVYVLRESGGVTRTVVAQVRDAAGNAFGMATEIGFDPNPPVIDSAVLVGAGQTLTRTANVPLLVTASDAISGLDTISVSHDGGVTWTAPVAFSSNLGVQLPEGFDGPRTVLVRVVDKAGNASEASASIVLDRTPPALVVTLGNGSGWTRSSMVDVTLTASDAYFARNYCLSPTEITGNPLSACSPWADIKRIHPGYSLTAGDGLKQVWAYVRDQAGNVASAVGEIQVDTVPPAITQVQLNEGATFASSPTVRVSVTIAEPPEVQALMSVELSHDGGASWSPPRPLTASLNFTLPNNTNGVRTVHARVTDAAGNTSVGSDSITLDTQPPVGQVRINGGDEQTATSLVQLDLTWDDNFDVTRFCARNVGGAAPAASHACWQDVSASVAHELEPGDGARAVFVYFRDAAGNVSSVASASIVVRSQAPALAGFDEAGTKARHRGVDVAWLPASDGGSGVAGYQVGWSTNDLDFEWQPLQLATAASIEGLQNGRPVFVRYRAVNDVGGYAESESVELLPSWPFEFRQRLPAPTRLRAVARAGDGATVAVGDAGLMLRTTNAGDSWMRVDPLVDDDLTAVAFRDALRGAVATSSGKVLFTKNGGISWSSSAVSGAPIEALSYVSSSGGADVWLAAGADGLFQATLATYDGSESWTAVGVPAEAEASQLRSVTVCPTGCAAGGPVVAVTGTGGVLLRSTDGGQTFSSVNTGGLELRGATWHGPAFFFASDESVHKLEGTTFSTVSTGAAPFQLNGIVRAGSSLFVFGATSTGERSGRVAQFAVATGTFSEELLPAGTFALSSAQPFDAVSLLAVGEAGTLVRRSGTGWEALSTGSPDAFAAAAASSDAVWFAGEGDRLSRLDRTTGALTTLHPGAQAGSGADANWTGVAAIDEDEIVLVGESGTILRSRDGGASFVAESGPAGMSYRAISCLSTELASGCLAVGSNEMPAISVNGSANWLQKAGSVEHILNDVVATGVEVVGGDIVVRGLVVASDGSVRSFDGENTSSATLNEDGPLFAIDARDGVVVAAGADGFLARSTDGGSTWGPAALPSDFDEDLLSVEAAGDGVWFASGSGGAVLKSVDDGQSWWRVATGTKAALSAIVSDGLGVWVAGDAGAVLESGSSAE